MKVKIVAIVVEGNTVSGWHRDIEMPVAPMGLDTISVDLGDTSVLLNVESVGWNEGQNAYVVGTAALTDGPKSEAFHADKRWQPTDVNRG